VKKIAAGTAVAKTSITSNKLYDDISKNMLQLYKVLFHDIVFWQKVLIWQKHNYLLFYIKINFS